MKLLRVIVNFPKWGNISFAQRKLKMREFIQQLFNVTNAVANNEVKDKYGRPKFISDHRMGQYAPNFLENSASQTTQFYFL